MLVALVAIGRRLAACGLLPAVAVEPLASAIAELPAERTTTLAHHFLREACARRYPTPLARVVEALGDPDVSREELAARVGALAATGAHSGSDWLTATLALAHACLSRAEGDRSPVPGPRFPDHLLGGGRSTAHGTRPSVSLEQPRD